MKLIKIHIHSDNNHFGGSENMIGYILNSDLMNRFYDISFSYRNSRLYREQFNKKLLKKNIQSYPLEIPDWQYLNKLMKFNPQIISRIFRILLMPFFFVPVAIYEVILLIVYFKKINPNILHINNGGYPGAFSCRMAVIAGKIAKIPKIFMVVNNLIVDYKFFYRKLQYPIDYIIINSVDYFLTGSKVAGKRLQKVFKLSKNSIKNIPNGYKFTKTKYNQYSLKSFLTKKKSNEFYIGMLAVLEPRKGHKVLIDAIENIAKGNLHILNNKIIKIFIAGDGDFKNYLVNIVKKKNLEKYIVFLGYISDVRYFLKQMNIIVQPSLDYEDFPNAIIESMAFAKPVIGSKVAGIPEIIIDGVTGYIVEPGNSSQLSDRITKIMNDPIKEKKMGKAAKRRFKNNYNLSTILTQYRQFYNSLVK